MRGGVYGEEERVKGYVGDEKQKGDVTKLPT